jgi:hypothetical protein
MRGWGLFANGEIILKLLRQNSVNCRFIFHSLRNVTSCLPVQFTAFLCVLFGHYFCNIVKHLIDDVTHAPSFPDD